MARECHAIAMAPMARSATLCPKGARFANAMACNKKIMIHTLIMQCPVSHYWNLQQIVYDNLYSDNTVSPCDSHS
jgi:hypothetical protein